MGAAAPPVSSDCFEEKAAKGTVPETMPYGQSPVLFFFFFKHRFYLRERETALGIGAGQGRSKFHTEQGAQPGLDARILES